MNGTPASRQKGSLSLWMICKTREELLLILQLYYRLNWMKSRIRLVDVGYKYSNVIGIT